MIPPVDLAVHLMRYLVGLASFIRLRSTHSAHACHVRLMSCRTMHAFHFISQVGKQEPRHKTRRVMSLGSRDGATNTCVCVGCVLDEMILNSFLGGGGWT